MTSDQALPFVAVAQNEFVLGLDSLKDQDAPDLFVCALDAALEQCWEFDGHVASYQLVDKDGNLATNDSGNAAWSRINKSALWAIRELGLDLRTVVLIQDWDNPGHEAWTEESFAEFQSQFRQHEERGSWWATRWAVAYSTRAGARFIYVLSRPVPPEEAEPLHRGILVAALETGWSFDHEIKRNGTIYSRCSDWTRLMRLPRVVRDGQRTWESPFFWIETRFDRLIDPDEIVPQGEASRIASYAPVDLDHGDQPDQFSSARLLTIVNPATGKEQLTAWASAAKKRLKGRDSADVAFNALPLAPAEGPGRDTAMTRVVGEAASCLATTRGTTAAHIYALFLPSVEQFEPDRDTPDWTATLWDLCRRMWGAESAKKAAEDRAQEAADHAAASTVEETIAGIVNGMRLWCDVPELHQEELSAAAEWVSERLIALATSGSCYCMTKSGAYDTLGVPLPQLAARVRQLGMQGLITLKQPSADGSRMIDVPSSSLLATHATHVASIRGAVEVDQAWIEDIGKPTATLIVPAFSRRKDLVPTFDPEVDQWLFLLAGEENYEKLCEWIAWALAYDEGPECALSIAGKKSIGKSLLIQGLAETITTGALATVNDLVGNNQYGLLASPFLAIDEGLPENWVRHPADTFREFVGGAPLTINRKFLAPVTFRCPTRIILTANNNDVVGRLCAGRDMSAEDREAIGLRLFHLDVTHRTEAADWLRQKGGRAFTGKNGRRWVTGTAGEPSDYVVAKHFLWLHANRGEPYSSSKEGRLLVEGDPHAPIVEEMRMDSGIVQVLAKVLCEMAKAHDLKRVFRGFTIEKNKVWVTSGEVHDYFSANLANSTSERVNIKRISSGLRTLATRQHPVRGLQSRPGKQRWYEIEPGELYRLIQRHGYDLGANSSLERLVEGAPIIPFASHGAQNAPQEQGTGS